MIGKLVPLEHVFATGNDGMRAGTDGNRPYRGCQEQCELLVRSLVLHGVQRRTIGEVQFSVDEPGCKGHAI